MQPSDWLMHGCGMVSYNNRKYSASGWLLHSAVPCAIITQSLSGLCSTIHWPPCKIDRIFANTYKRQCCKNIQSSQKNGDMFVYLNHEILLSKGAKHVLGLRSPFNNNSSWKHGCISLYKNEYLQMFMYHSKYPLNV